jgi:hypothetical protein
MLVLGIDKVNAELKKIASRSNQKDMGNVIVGYTQSYAVYVHERQARHKEGKQWKYLESVLRRLAPEIPKIVATVYMYSNSLIKGLLVAGLRIQRESQQIVPIDTSALKASAYTAREELAPAAAIAAMARAHTATVSAGKRAAKKAMKKAKVK